MKYLTHYFRINKRFQQHKTSLGYPFFFDHCETIFFFLPTLRTEKKLWIIKIPWKENFQCMMGRGHFPSLRGETASGYQEYLLIFPVAQIVLSWNTVPEEKIMLVKYYSLFSSNSLIFINLMLMPEDFSLFSLISKNLHWLKISVGVLSWNKLKK